MCVIRQIPPVQGSTFRLKMGAYTPLCVPDSRGYHTERRALSCAMSLAVSRTTGLATWHARQTANGIPVQMELNAKVRRHFVESLPSFLWIGQASSYNRRQSPLENSAVRRKLTTILRSSLFRSTVYGLHILVSCYLYLSPPPPPPIQC